MSIPNEFEVTKMEIHYLPSCPCSVCEAERLRLSRLESANRHIKIPPQSAYALGIIDHKRISGYGSRVRELNAQFNEND